MLRVAVIVGLVGACATPTPLAHRLCSPRVGVRISPYADGELAAAARLAWILWGREIGYPIYYGDNVSGRVSITHDPAESALARVRMTRRRGCLVSARISVSSRALALPRAQLQSVIAHELGHVLGLRDSHGVGVMSPRLRTQSWPEHPLSPTRDESLRLRGAYNP